MIFRLAIISLVIGSCYGKTDLESGSLSRIVFRKYDNATGNARDTASDVRLYSFQDPKVSFSARTDVRGAFSFNSIPSGRYLLLIKSGNVKGSPAGLFREIFYARRELSEIFHDPMYTILPDTAYDIVTNFHLTAARALASEKDRQNLNQYGRYIDSITNYVQDRI